MNNHHQINYVELPSSNLTKTQSFYKEVFGWSFQDYGPAYVAIVNAGLDGGFYLSENIASTQNGSVLVVLYSDDIETTLSKVEQAHGTISKPIFSFPGGRRFHFNDLTGNELAVWSDHEIRQV